MTKNSRFKNFVRRKEFVISEFCRYYPRRNEGGEVGREVAKFLEICRKEIEYLERQMEIL